MKLELLDFLACPKCKSKLKISVVDKKDGNEITKGTLKCTCGCKFPVIDGLPRMYYNTSEAVKITKKIYSKEWDLFGYSDGEDDTWLNLDEDARRKRVMTALRINNPKEIKGKTILDAGCGNGRLSYNMSKLGFEVVAMDLSSGVEHASKNFKNKNLHYVQGDVTNIPFLKDSFDYVWSAGVLMMTPNTKKSFENLIPLVKKDGTLYIWVYGWPEKEKCFRCILWWSGWRFIMMWPDFIKEFFCNLYVPCRMLKEALLLKKPIDRRAARQKKRAFYDNINPYMYHHSPSEVKKWFKEHNFSDIKMPIEDFKTFCGFGISGIKK